MHDPNRVLKWVLVTVLVGLSLAVLNPPSRKLKGGIDLVGGTSLLFEIDTTGLAAAEQRDLSTNVMNILKDRVDPKSQLNLEWRPVGATRLEIRMPRPPAVAIVRRFAKDKALAKIEELSLKRYDVERALAADVGERETALRELERDVSQRKELIDALAAASRARDEAKKEGKDSQAIEVFSVAYEKTMGDLLATSLSVPRLKDVLALEEGTKRKAELDKIRAEYPAYDAGDPASDGGKLLTKAVEAYDIWAEDKGDLEDPSDLKRRLRGAGVLEFRILADHDPSSPGNTVDPNNPQLKQPISKYTDQLAKQGVRPKAGDRYRWFPVADVVDLLGLKDIKEFESRKNLPGEPIVEEYAGRHFVLVHNDPEYGLLRSSGKNKWKLERAFSDRDYQSGENVVSFVLDTRGGQLFRQLTGNNVNRQLCIMLDDSVMSAANIQEAIGERCQIKSRRFTPERISDLVRTLNAGSLPARVKETPLAEKTIGPSLGRTNREMGTRAAVWGGLSVVVFMLIYYGIAGGGVANIALALNLLFTLAIMALMQATFTLPGIAGLILTVGMAVDANVLIFERIREERARGVIFKKALNAGYEKAFSAILDGNLTTLITCIILGFVGSEEVKGFAITLGLGLATSMFAALTVTRLVFNTLIAAGWLTDLSMRRVIGVPALDWIGWRRVFWPLSTGLVVASMALFVTVSATNKEALYDIEFLGGTSVQVDLKPEHRLTDEEVTEIVTGADGGSGVSAAEWLSQAAERLSRAEAAAGEVVGQFSLTATDLTGEQLGILMRSTLEPNLERGGIHPAGRSVVFDSQPGKLTLVTFQQAVTAAVEETKEAASRLRRARVQTVEDIGASTEKGPSYEVVTTETDRDVVQAAILAAMGDRLAIQRSIEFTAIRDEELTKEPFFVVEASDEYLSDVIGGDANYYIQSYRGGAVVEVSLSEGEQPMAKEEFERRLREVSLQPEFEQFQTHETVVFPLGAGTAGDDGKARYRRFGVLGVDETVSYEENRGQWEEMLARPQLAQVTAALRSERSLSKVVQFAPQIAGQTQNRAIFGMVLAFAAIAVYVWLRFGTKDYGLAVLVALMHDVAITLGAVTISNFVFDNPLSRALLIEDFKMDLPLVAAILTIIGYSLNDTIVVFDRIRENRGRSGTLSATMINGSINQTLSRTILTSFTVFLVVFLLYVMGGAGIHVFSFALLVGIISGTYSTVAVAVPLVYRPRVLRIVVWAIIGLGMIGVIFATVDQMWIRLVLSGVTAAACAAAFARTTRGVAYPVAGHPAAA